MSYARDERDQLCDLFEAVGPDAPTLNEGWTTHDLAAHLWVRENDPLAGPGLLVPPLSGLTTQRMDSVKTRWSFTELVQRLRRGPEMWSPMRIGFVDSLANTVEYFIHHEDVRRGQAADELGETVPPRQLAAGEQDALWRQLKLMAPAQFRSLPVGVVLRRTDVDDLIHARQGSPIVTITGPASELLLFASGRRTAADVQIDGDPTAIQALLESKQSL